MANDLQTLANVLKVRDTDLGMGLINTILDDTPLLRELAAKPVPGYQNIYRRRTGAPTTAFRAENAGREHDKTDFTKITEDLSFLDFTSQVDVAVAQSDIRGWEACVAEEAQSHLASALSVWEKQLLNDTGSGFFTGFAGLTTLDALADEMVIGAGGAGSDTSSVYAIRTGPQDVMLTVGQSGMMDIGATYQQQVEQVGTVDTYFQAYITPGNAWVGCQIANTRSVARLANIDAGAPLTDDLISDLLATFPANKWPQILAMSRRSWQQLQDSRTATSVTGAPAPFPDDAFGVKIIVTDSILDTETAIT